ncbi:MAG: 4-(cytidine 5'-diphospho)-2-C-methyl-D-erythritol kinase [Bacteroidales bacterium]|nr:4-(cytidine 5'-diphospho)-2-C-methyl-D-erythritol kinase [Bacteroidales bacterium]
MILYPNAKINIGLRILEKRADGFHAIETLFVPIDLCDILEFAPAGDGITGIGITGIDLDGKPDDNLVVRAWQLMKERYDIPAVKIHLHKIIPVGAGLGGGSADAAFMLRGLNEQFALNCGMQELEEMAAMLGSDCSFFIRNRPAIGTGRGELLSETSMSLENYRILLVNPAIHISSKEAYSGVLPAKPENTLEGLLNQGITSWQQTVHNEFEKSIFKLYPKIEQLKLKLLEMGAVYAAMSGSGSSVYGLFPEGIPEEMLKNPYFGNLFTFYGKLLTGNPG